MASPLRAKIRDASADCADREHALSSKGPLRCWPQRRDATGSGPDDGRTARRARAPELEGPLDRAVRGALRGELGQGPRLDRGGQGARRGRLVTEATARVRGRGRDRGRRARPAGARAPELDDDEVVYVDAQVRRGRQAPGPQHHPVRRDRDRHPRRARARVARAAPARPRAGGATRRWASSTGSTRRRAAWWSSLAPGWPSRPHLAVSAAHSAPPVSRDRARRRPRPARSAASSSRTAATDCAARRERPGRKTAADGARGDHARRAPRAPGRRHLVACRLETGRTHQIRIHLSEAGNPLVGERVYVRGFRDRSSRRRG